MSIINILYKTAILLACSIIQVIGVIVEGAARLFREIGKYLELAHDTLVRVSENKKVYKGKYTTAK